MATARPLPLAGIRIADLTQVWAGPKGTQILAYLGAEVIKVESPARPDITRGVRSEPRPTQLPGGVPGERPFNRRAQFNSSNRRKLGITLDLRKPTGLAVFKRLVAVSDVVTENFSAGVMERLGLGYEQLKAMHPAVIVLSMPGFGTFGPERDYVSWAPTVEAMAGITHLVGYEGGRPMKEGAGLPDPLAGIFGAAAVLTALRERDATGEGQFIELSQQEALLGYNAAAFIDWQLNRRIPERHGNRHENAAPQGVYPGRDPDTWIAITVRNDREWSALRAALGSPAWAAEARFDSLVGRLAVREQLDARIAEWTKGFAPGDLAQALQRVGVAAGPVLSPKAIRADAHLKSREAFESVPHADAGTHAYFEPLGVKLSRTGFAPARGAPAFGEHNHTVLGGILGMTQSEIAQLERDNVISQAPL